MVTIDPGGVRNVGNKLYPVLAEIFKEVGDKVGTASRLNVPNQERLQTSLMAYLTEISGFIRVSESRLRDCGEALVEMSDELTTVDGKNADSIANPVSGTPSGDGKIPESSGDTQ